MLVMYNIICNAAQSWSAAADNPRLPGALLL